MKKIIFSLLLASLCCTSACGSDDNGTEVSPPTPDPSEEPSTPSGPEDVTAFVRGADISWYTEMKADGKNFYNQAGEARECPVLMKEIGMNAVRLRVWVKPQNKGCNYSDAADVTAKAQAAKEAGLNVMIDFHFSDWWADPSRQDMPADWVGLDLTALKAKVAEHVNTTLLAIKQTGVDVAWIQIGNETRNGMMHPTGQLWNESGDLPSGWQNFVALYKAGYDAAKAVYPQAYVMPHLNHAYEDNDWWVKRFKAAGAAFDMIALSHYPQADYDSQTWTQLNQSAVTRIKQLAQTYGVPVMVSEFGVEQSNVTLGAYIASDFMTKVKALGNTVCAGVFYWEPEVYGNWKPASYNAYGWGPYTMGAFASDGKPTAILDAWQP